MKVKKNRTRCDEVLFKDTDEGMSLVRQNVKTGNQHYREGI